jgi:hypothetical protein
MPDVSQFYTTNYLVPSNGQTHAIVYSGQFSATPFFIDWRQFAIDVEKFQPQGVFIDNTEGTVPLVINIQPINYNVTCPAGQVIQAQFPAPNGQTCTVVGDPANTASVTFVDFPVLPSATQAQIVNTVNVAVKSFDPAAVVHTDPNPLAAGNTLPYRAQEYVSVAEPHYLTISGATTSVNVVPTVPSQNLRKLQISLTPNATLAAAGLNTVTATLNGVIVFKAQFYLPAAITANPLGNLTLCDLDASALGLAAGAGNLTVAVTTALATGAIDVNAYFTPQ